MIASVTASEQIRHRSDSDCSWRHGQRFFKHWIESGRDVTRPCLNLRTDPSLIPFAPIPGFPSSYSAPGSNPNQWCSPETWQPADSLNLMLTM